MTPLSANLLKDETSPYLLQHKDNPVHWMAWGDAAFARAKAEDKPVILSIGYAACHWCHVMAHESFEDDETAQLMNAHFVAIKVDREERPDVDRLYMQALHSLGEQGGWPLTMFLTPDGHPFWGGTYFPKESLYGRPSFRYVLKELTRIWRDERDKVETNATAILSALNREPARPTDEAHLSLELAQDAAQVFLRAIDFEHGGLKGAPKFPQASLFSFLWTMAEHSRDPRLADAVTTTLTHICQGGIYDHLGGGFARYSVDPLWLVPHFEKMLYDNAQLVSLMARVASRTGNPLFRVRIEETIGFVLREMTTPIGAFAASYDADSEGEEGKFYVWSADEIARLLPEKDYTLFARTYDVTSSGNWEGHIILNRLSSLALLDPDNENKLAASRDLLFAQRKNRIPPGYDDKVLADWNGLMISALADAALLLARPDWAQTARAAFAAIIAHHWRDGRLHHSWRDGRLRYDATAEGYAHLITAALALGAITPGGDHLATAEKFCAAMIAHHWDAKRGAFAFASNEAGLIHRGIQGHDDATPNANGVMLRNLTGLHHLTGNPDYLDKAQAIHRAFAAEAISNPFGYASLIEAFTVLADPVQIVMSGKAGDPFADPRFRRLVSAAGTNAIIQWVDDPETLPATHPARHKSSGSETRAYLCRGQVCAAPAETVEQVEEALALLGVH
ncbi:thioredoxin domain-containing protein [Aestuariivirga sp. YIM B02566]|uniref:Thioredoxin domain-containing protein n=1 Tax=Taklimakanibacter albus TaxID=2800327 RepID=A0ACC5QWQ4_9HYPH|nr:thioredoxin domain-containing protein [Aestuariivirga sp. YIM B02566]MBK1864780.1 thioredoxin domain-containing protein [Aestuariivirga sp. YIM B02566]